MGRHHKYDPEIIEISSDRGGRHPDPHRVGMPIRRIKLTSKNC
jgi:hypothetical protein